MHVTGGGTALVPKPFGRGLAGFPLARPGQPGVLAGQIPVRVDVSLDLMKAPHPGAVTLAGTSGWLDPQGQCVVDQEMQQGASLVVGEL
jgi:hypothetical protein